MDGRIGTIREGCHYGEVYKGFVGVDTYLFLASTEVLFGDSLKKTVFLQRKFLRAHSLVIFSKTFLY